MLEMMVLAASSPSAAQGVCPGFDRKHTITRLGGPNAFAPGGTQNRTRAELQEFFVANAEEIYSLPGVDAIFVGPVDLRAQMRKPDGTEASDEAFEAMLQRVIAIGKKTGTPTGMHVMDPQAALQRAEQGMQFIAIGSELRMMTEKAAETLAAVRPGGAKKELVKY